jgi:hypothetical protein
MPFDLVPPLDDAQSAAVRAFLAASELSLDSAPVAYGTAWRRAAAEEAAGYDTDDMQADLEPRTRPPQRVGPA